MSRLISKIYTTSRAFHSFVFIFSLFLCPQLALADKGYSISGHYFITNPQKPGRYKEVAQWSVDDANEWVGFTNRLRNLPRIDLGEDIIDPMSLGNPEVIYFKQLNPDQITGNDIYLSKTGILQFAKMPVDSFFMKDSAFRFFLENELTTHPGYGELDEKNRIDVTEPGIVVVYRGSSLLENPMWVVKSDDEKMFKKYLSFIGNLKSMGYGETARSESRNDAYDGVQTFLLYLNYGGAPFQMMSVSVDGGVRATIVKLKNYNYEDPKGYFKTFRAKAREIVQHDMILKSTPDAQKNIDKNF